ncbi:MAG: VWA domain-containing protein [Anaerolineae bacterium]
MFYRKTFVWLSLLAGLLVALSGCAAPQDASKARARYLIDQGVIVPADEIRVAEYLNYYEQHFPAPTDTALGLDLRLGNDRIPASGGEAWLQIGLQAREVERQGVTPLNLALVIDRSGSMDTRDKMPYLKRSLRLFFESLDPDDIVAVVAYSDNAEVVLPAQKVGNRRWIQRTVDALHPGGSTNLHAGLMLGFQEVDKHFDIRRNNRVILLTDGIANRGVTDPARIAADAARYNERGIYLSTIGLGLEFNDALLSQLARQGKGGYHFIDSAEEMDKVFRQEVAGLVEKVASDVSMTVHTAPGVQLLEITGYEGRPPADAVQVRLQDMGDGDSQVVVVRLAVDPGRGTHRMIATVTADYFDVFAQRPESIEQHVTAATGSVQGYDPLWNLELLRNVSIQRTAEGLKEIDSLYHQRRFEEAWRLAYDLEQSLREVAALTGDEAMYKDADLLRRYQDTLTKQLRYEGRQPPSDYRETSPRPYRGRYPTPTPQVPVIEVK